MTTQIAVRLPEALVAYLDEAVARGEVPSRAALVTAALERERRARAAARDAAILRATGSPDDLDELVRWSIDHAVAED